MKFIIPVIAALFIAAWGSLVFAQSIIGGGVWGDVKVGSGPPPLCTGAILVQTGSVLLANTGSKLLIAPCYLLVQTGSKVLVNTGSGLLIQ